MLGEIGTAFVVCAAEERRQARVRTGLILDHRPVVRGEQHVPIGDRARPSPPNCEAARSFPELSDFEAYVEPRTQAFGTAASGEVDQLLLAPGSGERRTEPDVGERREEQRADQRTAVGDGKRPRRGVTTA